MNNARLVNIKWVMLLLCLPFIGACSKEDLPAYSDAEITKVGFYHRFYGPDKDVITGEPIVVEKELTCTCNINSENATADVTVTVPAASGKFTTEERDKVVQGKLWGYLNVSTAARVTPMEGAPKLGTPGDWTSVHKYKIMAADGTEKIWTVKVSAFNK